MKQIRHFHWVKHHALSDWLACGWIMVPCEPMHHHDYSFMCEWLCSCPMPRPKQ